MNIIHRVPKWIRENGVIVDGRKRRLKNLGGGRTWRYLLSRHFPDLRATVVEVVFLTPSERVALLARRDTLSPPPSPLPLPAYPLRSIAPADSVLHPVAVAPLLPPAALLPGEERKPVRRLAFRTNLFFDAALIPNGGVEVSLGRGWTVAGHYANGWWRKWSAGWWHRLEIIEVDARRYFNRAGGNKEASPFRGWHAGGYAHLVTYDFTFDDKGYIGGRWSWGAGVTAGRAWPIGRRLSLDAEIGIGYLGGEYREYTLVDGHRVWQATRHRHWFGPTRVGLSLVWLFGRGNYNILRNTPGKGGQP